MDIVIPCAVRDFGRLTKVLVPSLRKFWRVPGNIFVFVKEEELEPFKEFCGEIAPECIVRSKSELLTDAGVRRLRDWCRPKIAKIAGANVVEGPYFLSLDADSFLTRTLTLEDVIRNGRCMYGRVIDHGISKHLWQGAANILQVEAPSAMPLGHLTFLSVTIMKSLQQRLTEIYEMPWQKAFAQDLEKGVWSVYSLYYLEALRSGLFETLHFSTDYDLSGHGLWEPKDRAAWDPAKPFYANTSPFCCVQSQAGLTAEEVAELVAPYLTT